MRVGLMPLFGLCWSLVELLFDNRYPITCTNRSFQDGNIIRL
jgi:hypothetical protein